jgi:hypothetical protein
MSTSAIISVCRHIRPHIDRNSGMGRVSWSAQADVILTRMKLDGLSLRAMASACGLSRSAVATRVAQLGLTLPRRPVMTKANPNATAKSAIDVARPPLPAGHPISWALITQGTSLEGAEYERPDPARLRSRRMVVGAPRLRLPARSLPRAF